MKSLRIPCTLLLAALFLSAGGCSKDDNPSGPTSTSVLWPLKIGDSWKLAGTSLDSNGVTVGRDTTTFTITQDTTIGGEKWYYIDPFELLANRSDGLWYRIKDSAYVPVLFAKHPANVADTWKSLNGYVATRISSGYLLTVPAGTYTAVVCTHADSATGRRIYTWYFAPNVGWVRSESYSRTPSGREYISWRRDLVSITLVKAGHSAEPVRGGSLFAR